MTETSPKLLGIAASLRNARWGAGSSQLIDELRSLDSEEALYDYLRRESELHLENFLDAGRSEGADFLTMYHRLRKLSGEVGLSNSEVALAAGLWAAKNCGTEIDHLSLVDHFSASGRIRDPETLRRKLLSADGLLISGPVYFGDRGSVAESLIDYIARDAEIVEHLRGKPYGGIAVGAKRNGGQETTLIYQMLDALDMGMLAVGNDSETTSQYGGTGWAGDVGTMHKDSYGLETSKGTGRRMARVLSRLNSGAELTSPPKVLFLILQEANGLAARAVQEFANHPELRLDATILDISQGKIRRCLACDICPTHVDIDEEYRCIIKSNNDDMSDLHLAFLDQDMIVPVVASVRDRTRWVSNYQAFVERTRYLRRGDYVLSDLIVSPLLIAQPGAPNSLLIRMVTSFIRHHTVMARPAYVVAETADELSQTDWVVNFGEALSAAGQLAAGRLASGQDAATKYNPVGYVISTDKDKEDEKLERRRRMVEARNQRQLENARQRLRSHGGPGHGA